MTDKATGAASTPLYKYVDIAGLKRILQGSMRFTQPSAFNDPFELLPEVVVPNDCGKRGSLAFRSMSGRNAGSRRQVR